MIEHTTSATALTPVMVEPYAGGAHVWLRKNITQAADPETGQDVWTADEAYYYSSEPVTVEAVEADFAALWLAHESDGQSTEQALAARIEQLEAAAVELADLLAGGE